MNIGPGATWTAWARSAGRSRAPLRGCARSSGPSASTPKTAASGALTPSRPGRSRAGWAGSTSPATSPRSSSSSPTSSGPGGRGIRPGPCWRGWAAAASAPTSCATPSSPQAGALFLDVLDSTDPSTIAALSSRIDLARTAFIISSKSGGTTETLSHFKLFHQRVAAVDPDHAGHHFIAVTDEGSGLQKIAEAEDFGWVFLNPPDIGGRYSALSYFGMVPAAVMGLDVTRLLAGGQAMGLACRADDAARNPGLFLGAVLGAASRQRARQVHHHLLATRGDAGDVAGAAAGRVHRQRGQGDHPHRGRAPGTLQGLRPGPTLRPRPGRGRRRPARTKPVEALRAAGHPVMTVEMADILTTSAPSSSAGSSPPRRQARSWRSTPLTSPTSRRARTTPTGGAASGGVRAATSASTSARLPCRPRRRPPEQHQGRSTISRSSPTPSRRQTSTQPFGGSASPSATALGSPPPQATGRAISTPPGSFTKVVRAVVCT